MPTMPAGHWQCLLCAFLREEAGATAIEYALTASLLSISIVGSALLLGGGLQDMWNFVATEVTTAATR